MWVKVLLSLTSFVPRIGPMKIVGTGQAFSRFSLQVIKGVPWHVFPLLFPPVLHLLSASMPLFYWAGHHLSISESFV